ncbi:bifunctional diaminohydroxyphosphoribosylaminopyrimidine deaminase/5-amino-6-(5-phosphoribosylamino)uracil reductase RibD [uncultured Draconibacterium sp.]|uniref:bifunctional diaminohydroxyphosphoribosylaminopyrimidine deaminase/5-amino-6-(5-phosphoribosylamino)uracil reductase RibD n=1 Tax=uncultured Draconibacterium sp. TaxID=1573823 RepID=UPI00321766FC
MTASEKYMARCIELAKMGAGNVSPNPMVGCVIVLEDQIIGEGYHQKYGEAHAEVNAINSVANPADLKKSTIYVSLEPCAHYGLTPPCADLIVANKIPRVVIGSVDPFAKVAGKGIQRLINAGIDVKVGVLENECKELNKRFFNFHEKKRPYIILKWAQTLDGFIDIDRSKNEYGEPTWITGNDALLRVHKMRAEEDAILVGTNTAQKDNPSLTVRHCEGKNPLRIVIDKNLRLDRTLHLFNNSTPTLVLNSIQNETQDNTEFVQLNFEKNILPQLLKVLHSKNCLSLIVEGGKKVLESFITKDLWDEAHVFTGNKHFGSGIEAPKLQGKIELTEQIENDRLIVYKNRH